MHPEIVSAKAGDCPKCGINLVEKTVVTKPEAAAQIKPGQKTEIKPEIKNKPEPKAESQSRVLREVPQTGKLLLAGKRSAMIYT